MFLEFCTRKMHFCDEKEARKRKIQKVKKSVLIMFGIKNRKARQKLLVFYKRKGIIPMAFFQWLQKLKERERERQRELNETQLGNVFKGEDKQRSRALQAFYPEFPIPTSQCRILCCLFPDFINFNFLTSPIFLFFFFLIKTSKQLNQRQQL